MRLSQEEKADGENGENWDLRDLQVMAAIFRHGITSGIRCREEMN